MIKFLSIIILKLLFLLDIQSNGASQFASFSANEEDCTKLENNQTKCHVSHETILTLTPSHRIAKLLIRGANKLPMGIVDITIEDIVVECQKSSEYFSRSHEIKTYSSKRCPKQGSCTGNTCANTKLDSKIPELNAVNDLPGNTFCIDSCSFLMCGCGFPTTSCIFYRLHSVERSKKIYEFFNCPAWQYAIELAIERTDNKGTTQIDKIRLYNGILTETSGLKLAINAITKAPTPILATRFLTDGDKVMIANHLNSKLYCATQGEAESFSGCQLDADACKCSVTDPTVTCQCKNGRLDKIFLENPAKVLPIISQNFVLKNEKNRLYASLPRASIELQVSMENYQLIATHDRVKCEISPSALIGCYSCIAGASFELNCTPSFGNGALAHVYCVQKSGKHFEFSLFCSGQHKVPLALENADISANCTVNCPAGETHFQIKGKLKYIIQQNWLSLIHAQSTQALAENSIDWAFLGYFFLGLPQRLFLLVATFLAIIVIILLIRVNPIHKIWKLIFRIIITLIIITNSNSLIYSNKMNNEQLSNISPASSPTNSENSNIYYGPAPPPPPHHWRLKLFHLQHRMSIKNWKRSGLKKALKANQAPNRKKNTAPQRVSKNARTF
uniref:Phlebovirus glycoprotein G2 fusion domain-containing protein n=1 Tax=Meloidogyne incognita TaxID=6306 RepID=A0A914MLI5_MELIC